MKINRKWLRAHCRIALSHEDEDTSYSDHFEHPEDRAWVDDQLRRGNAWAWCQIGVRVDFKGFESKQYLGACSYESEEAFRRGGSFEDLVNEGVEEIAVALEMLSLEHGLWEHDPILCVWCVAS